MNNLKTMFEQMLTKDQILTFPRTRFYDLCINSEHTNIGFRLSYFLWIMRGENRIEPLSYYSEHIKSMSDNGIQLKGAIGPRLINWVGADQLQECITKNQDIDNPEIQEKPRGVNQLEAMYIDLMNGCPVSCCQIFNPSIDFQNSVYLPDISTIHILWQHSMDLTAFVPHVNVDEHFINDMFFLMLLHVCFCKITQADIGNLNLWISKPVLRFSDLKWCEDETEYPVILPENEMPETLWEDIFNLCSLEKHLRQGVTKDSVNNPRVNIEHWCDELIRTHMDKCSCQFWKDYGYTLIASVLNKYGEKFEDYVNVVILRNIKGQFKREVSNGKK